MSPERTTTLRGLEHDQHHGGLRECSGMTPEPAIRDETANNSDDSPADEIQRDHAAQQQRQHHQRCAALPVAVNPSDHNLGTTD
jgi:hypothetical protein